MIQLIGVIIIVQTTYVAHQSLLDPCCTVWFVMWGLPKGNIQVWCFAESGFHSVLQFDSIGR